MTNYKQQTLTDNKELAVELLKSIETGDTKLLAYINPNKYVRHNLAVGDGLTGVKALWQLRSKGQQRLTRCAFSRMTISCLRMLSSTFSAPG